MRLFFCIIIGLATLNRPEICSVWFAAAIVISVIKSEKPE